MVYILGSKIWLWNSIMHHLVWMFYSENISISTRSFINILPMNFSIKFYLNVISINKTLILNFFCDINDDIVITVLFNSQWWATWNLRSSQTRWLARWLQGTLCSLSWKWDRLTPSLGCFRRCSDLKVSVLSHKETLSDLGIIACLIQLSV